MSATFQTFPDRVEFLIYGERFTTYEHRGETPGFTAFYAGDRKPITRLDPLTKCSLWLSHGNVNGFSFVTREPDQSSITDKSGGVGSPIIVVRPVWGGGGGKGTIRTIDFIARRGSESVGFQHELLWSSPTNEPLLNELRTARLTPGPSAGSILDLNIELRACDTSPVLLGKTAESLLQILPASSLLPAGGGHIINSLGASLQEDIHGRAAAWCGCTGVVGDETVGFVLFDHPQNPWHPSSWNISESGALSPSPFEWREFEVTPAKPLALRYRLMTHTGFVEAGWARARMREFANQT